MPSKLHIPLRTGWVDETPPNSIKTYYRNPTRSGPLQVSWMGAKSGKAPSPSAQQLGAMAADFGIKQFGCGSPRETSNGSCAFGFYGTAIFSLPPDRCHGQIWILSKGTGFLIVTYMSAKPPDPIEVEETRQMVLEIVFVEI